MFCVCDITHTDAVFGNSQKRNPSEDYLNVLCVTSIIQMQGLEIAKMF